MSFPFLPPARYCPFKLSDKKDGMSQIGGYPPKAALTARNDLKGSRYLLSLELRKGKLLSVFSSLNWEWESPSSVLATKYELYDESTPLLKFVIHDPSPAHKTRTYKSEIPECAIVPAKESAEMSAPEYYDGHKFGGIPIFYQPQFGMYEKTEKVFKMGYVHLFQLCFPDSKDCDIDCNWPFGQFVFHIFGREKNGKFDFMYGWA